MKEVFCPRCKKLISKLDNFRGGILACDCGYLENEEIPLCISEKSKKKAEFGKGVFENRSNTPGFPNKCKKCGYSESEVVDLGISFSDESSRFLFKCKKCGYVERYAEGSSNG
jgi:DNA-directed RNA polymerase subunit M/transcription elongation factor TFIIS